MPVDALAIGLILAMGGSPSTRMPDDVPAAQVEVMPAAELLEFLGSWSMDDGDWIGPQTMEQLDLPKLNDAAPDGGAPSTDRQEKKP